MTYERKVGRYLRRLWPEVVSGQWFLFCDENGRGYCQPDHYVVLEDQVLCIECKLSQRGTGYTQIAQLYKPVLEHVYRKPVVGVQACKILRYAPGEFKVYEPYEALGKAGLFTWHFLGA